MRITPSGRSSADARSATDAGFRQSRMTARCSGSRSAGSGTDLGREYTIEMTSSISPAGFVRPRTSAYGRTTGPGPRLGRGSSAGATAWSRRFASIRRGPAVDRRVPAQALDDQGHLVGNEADVGLRSGEHGEAASVSGGGHEQETPFHLDDGLLDLAAIEAARATGDRKSTRLNSSHVRISYAVFC